MKVFLIVVAVLALIIALICSLSATFTIIYDNKWKTTIQVLWIERDIELTKILSFIMFPEKAAENVKKKKGKAEEEQPPEPVKEDKPEPAKENVISLTDTETGETFELNVETDKIEEQKPSEPENKQQKPQKQNFLKKMWDTEGIVGMMQFVSNLLQTAGSAINTLFRGFHIYSLYVKIIVGGGDADFIAKQYGSVCKYYYPLKGAILNGMRVDNYDDLVMPDYIAPRSEYGLQFIGSISIGLLFKMVGKAGKTFIINILKK